jgi:DnaJ-domain-containing protein 1
MAVSEGINDKIHDDLISHDIAIRRVTGDCQRRAEKRLDRLASDLKQLTAKIDPFGTERTDARERRMERLDAESKKLIEEAYREIGKENQSDMTRLVRVEEEATLQALGKHLP